MGIQNGHRQPLRHRRWMAYVQALEAERPDAISWGSHFRRLAGEATARAIGDVEMISPGDCHSHRCHGRNDSSDDEAG